MRLNVIMMLKIWMELPNIHAMKHIMATLLMGAVARANSAYEGGWEGPDAADRAHAQCTHTHQHTPPACAGAW